MTSNESVTKDHITKKMIQKYRDFALENFVTLKADKLLEVMTSLPNNEGREYWNKLCLIFGYKINDATATNIGESIRKQISFFNFSLEQAYPLYLTLILISNLDDVEKWLYDSRSYKTATKTVLRILSITAGHHFKNIISHNYLPYIENALELKNSISSWDKEDKAEFLHKIRTTIRTLQWEGCYNKISLPKETIYLKKRLHTISLLSFFCCIRNIAKIKFTNFVIIKKIALLEKKICYVTAFTNDILGYEKDIRENEFNIIRIYNESQSMPLDHAYRKAVELRNKFVKQVELMLFSIDKIIYNPQDRFNFNMYARYLELYLAISFEALKTSKRITVNYE